MWTAEPDRIRQALRNIDPLFLNMPLRRSDALDRLFGAELLFKDETANPIRSFKGRGTGNFVETLASPGELVSASAGNFGQGLAWAGRRRGVPVTIFASRNAVRSKIEAMRGFGATVVQEGEDFDAAKEVGQRFAAERGLLFVEDGSHAEIAEGAGTIALEITEATGRLDALLSPLGNGALAAGLGAWLKHVQPTARLIAVSAGGAPAMGDSVRTGTVVLADQVNTIADGIAIRVPIESAVHAVRAVTDEVVFVGDDHIRHAMRLLKDELGLVVEPAGAAGFAAVVADPSRWRGRRIAVPLCGGNV